MPRKSNSSPKREELIEIASRLFYEQGYGATGIKQVIEEAGIAKGTFYSHFRSKEDLGLEWLKLRHAGGLGRGRRLLKVDDRRLGFYDSWCRIRGRWNR